VRKSRSAGQLTLPSFIIGQSARNTNDSVKISPRENALSPNSKNIEINRGFSERIVGKSGCSKSLSMQLITSNLRGPDSAFEWLKQLPQVYVVAYQVR